MSSLILAAAILTLGIGATVFWANPHRLINKAFLAFSLINASWLYCVFMAMRAGVQLLAGEASNPIPWIRAASAAGAFFPLLIWSMKESILTATFHDRRFIRSALGWFVIGCCLAGLCYADSFVFDEVESANRSRGIAYTIYSVSSFGLYLFLTFQTYRQWRAQTGIRRLEMQFLILNAGIAGLLAIIVNAAGNYLDLRFLPRLTPLIIVIFYGLTAWAVTVHRVFDAKQVFLSVVHRLTLILALGLGILGIEYFMQDILPPTVGLILSVAVGSSFAFLLERKTREWFRLTPEQHIAELRSTMLEAARSEPSPDKLVTVFEGLLRTWGQASYARLLFDSGEAVDENPCKRAYEQRRQ